jgi:asparagine synthase (glutamine-hydrolysing)
VNQGVWWTPKIGDSPAIKRNEACAQIRAGFEAAVTSWSSSDVPIACSLSGGLDSSAIVGLLANQGHRLRTYSVGFTGQAEATWNELPLAHLVAQRWGTKHEEIVLDPINLLDDLLDMVWHLDEPYGGGLPAWGGFKGMSGVVKVGMSGTGGDELFGNYGKWRELEGGPARRWFGGQQADLARFSKKFFNNYYYLNDEAKHRWVFQHAAHGFNTSAWMYESVFQCRPDGDLRDRIAGVDLETQLPEEFLMMTDRFSMAHSVEARTPFLDNQFADLVLGLPASLRTHRSDLKGLFRDSIADLIPPQLVYAPKRGFVIPLTLWLRGTLKPLVEKLLAPERLASQGIFKADFYPKYVRPHVQGKANFTQIVWAALMFQLWHVVFIEGAGAKPTFEIADLVKS